MYFVRSKVKSDTNLGHGFVDTYQAKTKFEAIQVAVSKYLDNFADTGVMGQRFLQLCEEHKADKIKMIDELFTFFQKNESIVFAGEYVDKTFSITLESDK
jgi:hypothetical protein